MRSFLSLVGWVEWKKSRCRKNIRKRRLCLSGSSQRAKQVTDFLGDKFDCQFLGHYVTMRWRWKSWKKLRCVIQVQLSTAREEAFIRSFAVRPVHFGDEGPIQNQSLHSSFASTNVFLGNRIDLVDRRCWWTWIFSHSSTWISGDVHPSSRGSNDHNDRCILVLQWTTSGEFGTWVHTVSSACA